MMEWRRHPRVREEIAVRWSMPNEGVKGTGVVRNMSISGLLLEVDERFKPVDNAPFTIQAVDATVFAFIPQNAQMVWFSHLNLQGKKRKFCGLKFVDPTGPAFTRLKEHIDGRLDTLLKATNSNIMNHYLYQYN